MAGKESTTKFEQQEELIENSSAVTERKMESKTPLISIGQIMDDPQKQSQVFSKQDRQDSLKDMQKNFRNPTQTKSDTTLSQVDLDMASRYTKSKYTQDLSSSYSCGLLLNDPFQIQKAALIDPNGITYNAMNQNTGHLYAVKTVNFIEDGFRCEIFKDFTIDQNIADRIIDLSQKSSNICRCFGIFNFESAIDIIYDHICGGSVQKIITSFNHINESLAAVFARQIFKGLEFLHQNDLTHGNLKISNILIDNDALIKITDTNIFVRNPEVFNYLKSTSSAPEMLLRNEVTPKSDVWSAAIVLLEMIAGNPWVLTTGQLMTIEEVKTILSQNKKFQIPNKIKPEFRDFLTHALEIDPQKRWSSSELLKHRFLKEAEQEEQSFIKQHSARENLHSQSSLRSIKGKKGTKLADPPSKDNYNNELKTLLSQKSDCTAKKNMSKFYNHTPSMRDLNPEEIIVTKPSLLDPNSPHESKLNIPLKKLSLTKTQQSLTRKVTGDYNRGYTIGSKVSYIKMLSVDQNDSFVDDRTVTSSQIKNFIHPNQHAAIVIANSIMEDTSEVGEYNDQQNRNQLEEKQKFIEQKMNIIIDCSDFQQMSDLNSFFTNRGGSPSLQFNQNYNQRGVSPSNMSSLNIKINDQPIDADFFQQNNQPNRHF